MTEQQAREFLDAMGAEISYWRKKRKLTRGELGQMVGLSDTTIGRIERGDVGTAAAAGDVWRIATALGLSLSDLARRTEEALALSEDAPSLGLVADQGEIEPGDLE
jgi:transcriptional regulator with XRE-family HTH domain